MGRIAMSIAYTIPRSAVCFGGADDYKRAALFFDHLVPLGDFPFDIWGGDECFGKEMVPVSVRDPTALLAYVGDPRAWTDAVVILAEIISARIPNSTDASTDAQNAMLNWPNVLA